MTRAAILEIIREWAETPYATYRDLLRMIAQANQPKGE